MGLKTHCFRLTRGADLKREIRRYAEQHHIGAAVVGSAVGCLTHACVRDASGITVHTLEERLEIVSLMGTVSAERLHLHIALAREDLSVIGGHMMEGCIVNTTAEVVLLELPGVRFLGAFDAETGYRELVMEREGEQK